MNKVFCFNLPEPVLTGQRRLHSHDIIFADHFDSCEVKVLLKAKKSRSVNAGKVRIHKHYLNWVKWNEIKWNQIKLFPIWIKSNQSDPKTDNYWTYSTDAVWPNTNMILVFKFCIAVMKPLILFSYKLLLFLCTKNKLLYIFVLV